MKKTKQTCLSNEEILKAMDGCILKAEINNYLGNLKACSDYLEQANFWRSLMEIAK